jgi:hypothetical protein
MDPTATATPGQCWELWLADLQIPPIAVCVHLRDHPPESTEPFFGILDMSRPRSVTCHSCAMVWANLVLADSYCACCGATTAPDQLLTAGRELPWGRSSTLLCVASLCPLCVLSVPGPLVTLYLSDADVLSWAAADDD